MNLSSTSGSGGIGARLIGGDGRTAGMGVWATAGDSSTNFVGATGGRFDGGRQGGMGIEARGGHATNFQGGIGGAGAGIVAVGGDELGTGGAGTGIIATSRSGSPAVAGRFNGNVVVTGSLSKGSGSFKIDHPLDPLNKYLYHSFVESPDMKNIYDGVAQPGSDGRVVVTLPEWFEALNKDFRYQLTSVGAPGPGLYISRKISGNSFEIAGGSPGSEVWWLVTGTRKDRFAESARIPVEEDKPEAERGHYLHPEAFGRTMEEGASFAGDPELRKMIAEKAAKRKRQ